MDSTLHNSGGAIHTVDYFSSWSSAVYVCVAVRDNSLESDSLKKNHELIRSSYSS